VPGDLNVAVQLTSACASYPAPLCLNVPPTSWDLDLALDVLHAPLTRESHSHGVRLKEFEANAALAAFYKPLSLSVDREGRVSAGRRCPEHHDRS
jgi:hypothetical protein